LQRERFLSAIELIKTHTQVIHVDGGVDYRLRALEKAEIYHYPLDETAGQSLAASFDQVAPGQENGQGTLDINGREIAALRSADGVVWFDFEAICGGPRSAADYIEMALCFQTVLISNLPRMGETDNDKAKRFITLVDEFYDRNVKLIVSADAAPSQLYFGNRLANEFKRTASRLEEMQSLDYLAKQHLT
jgi:cell division protein ZapE